MNAHRRRIALAPLVFALLAGWGCGYNQIQTLDERINAAESQIKVQLQRRADLIPNLVETVKAYAKQEQTIFIQVAEARAKLAGAVQGGNLDSMAAANAALTAPLGRLLAIAENYPQLKSNENFRGLQDQLEGTENRIAVARQDYNEAVKAYAKQEQTIFIQVAEARAKLAGAVQGGNLDSMSAANAALTAPLGRLLAIAENYPQLKSNENFRALQDQLEGTENRIAVARQDYNETVNSYNAYIRRFPQAITAKVLGKKPRSYFELQTPGAAEAPRVDFSK